MRTSRDVLSYSWQYRGHRITIVTQKVYRHQLKPVISTGATAVNAIFGKKTA
jgi:hypothetical protein